LLPQLWLTDTHNKIKMTSPELREKFLNFFEKKGHRVVPSSSLIPTDPSVLFATAGMQQFKDYYLGKSSPYGNRVCSSQKCFRTSDIEEVGITPRHLTFFEMLGNFSFNFPQGKDSYFRKEAMEFAYDFLVKVCQLDSSKLWVTIFKSEENIPKDEESLRIWQSLGFPRNKISEFNKKDNFWGPTGSEGPCGPTTEIHYDLTGKACQKEKNCLPNCSCNRFIELWNLVFNEYYQDAKGNLSPLKQKGIDTGMGLERLAMVCQRKSSVYETDLFSPIVNKIFSQNEKAKRIIADHIRGSVFLISEGIFPSNVERGYIVRRILRRAIRFGKLLNLPKNFLIPLVQKVVEIYKDTYPELKSKENDVLTVIQNEEEKFEKTLAEGLKNLKLQISNCKLKKLKIISGKVVFDLYQSYGFPLELTKELAKEENFKVDERGFKSQFKKHQEISRAGVEKKFGGLGKTANYQTIKLHTATHLLHQALREILGKNVQQMGSDITSERLRFDFSYPKKMTKEEIKKVEDLVNQKIKADLEVKSEEMSLNEALESGALAFFKEKYPEKVSIYSIGDFSKEICAGPHVKKTAELGYFKIIKEESVGANLRRIRAILAPPPKPNEL